MFLNSSETPSGMTKDCKELQDKNAASPIDVTPFGMCRLRRFVQLRKVLSAMFCRESGKVTDSSAEQSSNVDGSKFVMLPFIVMSSNARHFKKALPPIDVTWSGTIRLVRFVQL